MSYGTINESSIFVKAEVTEGLHVPPAAIADAMEILEDGFSTSLTREAKETKPLDGVRESGETRLGIQNVEASMSVYNRASATTGAYPPAELLFEGLLGAKRQNTAQVTTKASGNTTTVLAIEDADIAKFKVGDCVKVLEAGKFEVRPISVVTTTGGSASITFPFALENTPSNSVKIEKFSTFYVDESVPTLSLTSFLGGNIQENMAGMRVVSGQLSGWETGNISQWNFKLAGLSLVKVVDTPDYAPNFSGLASPPVMLSACVWLNGTKVAYNSLGLNIENTASPVLSACSASGKIASRLTELKVTGEINPYMEMDDIDRFTAFNLNSNMSVFGYAYNPTATAGEFGNVVAFWMPFTKVVEMPSGEQEGIMTDNIKFAAHRSLGGDSIFLGFI